MYKNKGKHAQGGGRGALLPKPKQRQRELEKSQRLSPISWVVLLGLVKGPLSVPISLSRQERHCLVLAFL